MAPERRASLGRRLAIAPLGPYQRLESANFRGELHASPPGRAAHVPVGFPQELVSPLSAQSPVKRVARDGTPASALELLKGLGQRLGVISSVLNAQRVASHALARRG